MEGGRPPWSWREMMRSESGSGGKEGEQETCGGDTGSQFSGLAACWTLLEILIQLVWGEAWALTFIKLLW